MKLFIQILTILVIASFTAKAQLNTGMFSMQYNDADGNTRVFSMDVPENYNEANEYPTLLALHGNGMPSTDMINWFHPNTVAINGITVCPDENNVWDGAVTMAAMGWVDETYNTGKWYPTGFSMGGSFAFQLALAMPTFFEGAILVNPAISGTVPADYTKNYAEIPFGIIIGTEDPNYATVMGIAEDIEDAGGRVLVIEKEGLGHVDETYLISDEFYADWLECWYFINGITSVEDEAIDNNSIVIRNGMVEYSSENEVTAQIVSLTGQVVMNESTYGDLSINVQDLQSGFYIALINDNGTFLRKKFSVVR